LNANTGAIIWAFQPRINIIPTYASVVDDRVFVGEQSIPGYMYSIDANTGDLIWDRQLELPVGSSPAVGGGKVYVGSNDNFVYCLDADVGSLVWRFETQGPVLSSPAVADGKVFVGSDDGFVYAIDRSSGIALWSYKTDNFVRSSPAVSDGKVFVGSDDGYLYAFGPKKETFLSLEAILTLAVVIVVFTLVSILLLVKSKRRK
jgi:outer membrane protein assembly factor BamB